MDTTTGSRLLTETSMQTFNYYYYEIWQKSGDPRVNQFPMMEGGPWTVLTVIGAYVYFVKYLGPLYMSSRKAFNLKPVIFVYNVLMVLLNGFFFYQAASYTRFGLATWHCSPIDPNAFDPEWRFKLTVAWLFVMSKFVDLFDTLFFVLRKNFHQVSALHVIHHALVPINCWLGLKYVPSESAAFMPFINSFIHTLMYSYYALSTLGPAVRPFLWWKKYLTQLQIIQLALLSLHCVYLGVNPNCNLPKVMFLVGLPQGLLFLYMFCRFFLKSYTKPDAHAHVKSS
ncbi:Elongation of very long chain fatty acids protein 1 [Halotydeus destructor]|nr:Elongation of very long chain fatty acids protein 1 [Halotydeus destructor]